MAVDASPEGLRRVATFLLALDAPIAAQVMRGLSETELSAITGEMTRLGQVDEQQTEEALVRFASSGADAVPVQSRLRGLLRAAVGEEKARSLLGEIADKERAAQPFRSLRQLQADQISQVLKGEHPQVIATVLSHLKAEVGYAVLRGLDEDLRYDVLRRITTTESQPQEIMRQVEDLLEARASEAASRGAGSGGRDRFQAVADLLNLGGPKLTKEIMEKMGKELPAESQKIQALMFVFEDLILVGDREMQKLLGELDKQDLVLALKTASPELKDKLLGNLSKRARDTLLEEMELLGPKPLSEVEEAQKRIVDGVRAMEDRGELTIARGGGEAMV